MSTPSSSDAKRSIRETARPPVDRPHREVAAPCRMPGRHRNRGFLPLLLLATAWPLLPGCGYSGGQFLYALGAGRMKKVPAQITLTQNPLLILVDDDGGNIRHPPARRYITEAVAQELLRRNAAKRIVPPETIDALRQVHANFDQRGCREVGEMAGAEQVLWIQVQDFLADEEISGASDAAFITVTVKVINVLEKEDRSRVRLWPSSPAGTAVSTGISGARAIELKSTDAISMQLSEDLAVKIAKFFYTHRPGDFDKPPGEEG
jgi:hypothetical protein